MKRSLLWTSIFLLLIAVAGIGCGKHHVKADGTPIDEDEVDGAASEQTLDRMRDMRQAVEELDELLIKGDAMSEEDRQDVLVLLETVDAQVSALIETGSTTGHKSIDRGLTILHDQVGKARTDAQATPPNYFEANNVAATCLNCHASLDAQ